MGSQRVRYDLANEQEASCRTIYKPEPFLSPSVKLSGKSTEGHRCELRERQFCSVRGEMGLGSVSEKPGKLEVGGASRDSTGLGALEEGLISS